MLKKWLIIPVFVVLFFIVGCNNGEEHLIKIKQDDLIIMDNLDEYMFRDDVQYVDLRNYDASFRSGFIYSFEIIPFFDYLDYRAFNRGDTYEFNPDQIIDEAELERLFDRDKAIFLYADGCIRSGYLKEVLNYMGYERVFVLGGFFEYSGENLVLGDGSYSIGNSFYYKYVDSNTDYTYYVYGTHDMGRKINEIRFDIIDDNSISLRSPNYDTLVDYNEILTDFEILIIEDIVSMNELYDLLLNIDDTAYGDIEDLSSLVDDGIMQLIIGLKAQ